MAKIQLLIEIEERLYKNIIDNDKDDEEFEAMDVAFCNAKPLPKGHGRLIDANYLKDVILLHSFHGNDKNIVPYSDRKGYRLRDREVIGGIINAPTIIEADKEG